jgi:hypothetical protein
MYRMAERGHLEKRGTRYWLAAKANDKLSVAS